MRNPPRSVRLEATPACQLRCPTCPTATGDTRPVLGGGYLRADAFRRFIADNPEVRRVELSNFGEMFLNPELLEIMAAADQQGVALTADNGVNLNRASEEVLEGLVTHRFRSLNCSIDGASSETYAMYRRGGDFDAVVANVRAIVAHKVKRSSPYPRLRWQFVVFGHNEHEITEARSLADELGMTFFLKLSWDDSLSPVQNVEGIRREVGLDAASREEHEQRHGMDYMREACHQLWTSPQINWDGKLLGCCENYWGDFGGNAFEDGLRESLEHEKLRDAREMLLGRRAAVDGVPCTTCAHYRAMRRRRNWLTMREIRLHQRLGRLSFHLRQPRLLAFRAASKWKRWIGQWPSR